MSDSATKAMNLGADASSCASASSPTLGPALGQTPGQAAREAHRTEGETPEAERVPSQAAGATLQAVPASKPGMLSKFRVAKQAEIDRLRALQAEGRLPAPRSGARPSLVQALQDKGPGAVIAEYKRASPSKGDINLGFSPEQIAAMYGRAGAAAVSVLTEEIYFKGSLDYLPRMTKPGLPLLRKDFLFDPLQVVATAATPASALLLIARCFVSAPELAGMIALTERLGLEPVVEVFDEADLELARVAQARIIQVNSRDLDAMTMNPEAHRRLIASRRPGEVWIAASGVSAPEQARELAAIGYDGILIGTGLMGAGDPEAALASIVAGAKGGAS